MPPDTSHFTTPPAFVITGTDTEVGKTVFAAALTHALQGTYWKPVQSGALMGEVASDTQQVIRLGNLSPDQTIPEMYTLSQPLSPHRAAELDGVTLDRERLIQAPSSISVKHRPLIIEGAGGVMVPLTRKTCYLDVFAQWNIPVIVCARTKLGTINHTLLTLEALKQRHINIFGVAFMGDPIPDTMETIARMAQVSVLGCLPRLTPLTADTLHRAFARHVSRDNFYTAPSTERLLCR